LREASTQTKEHNA